jgi:penicillin-binding protein 2
MMRFLRFKKPKYDKKFDWVEETYLPGKQAKSSEITRYIGNSFSNKKMLLLIFCFLSVFLIIFARIIYLQIINGNSYLLASEGNRQRIMPIESERGIIFDAKNRELTENVPNFSITLVPQDLPKDMIERELVVRKLSSLLKKEPREIRETLVKFGNYSYESIIIMEDIDYQTALSIQVASSDLPGIYIYKGSKRKYLHDGNKNSVSSVDSVSHILGYVGKLSPEELESLYNNGYLPSDSIGKTGVEKTYESYLKGKYGKKYIEVNSLGRQQSVLSEEAPEAGKHIKLSVDINLQQKLQEIIFKNLSAYGKVKGVGIAMNPNNGDILAMVSLPAYDNNDFSGGISETKYLEYIKNPNNPLLNLAISGVYPSGSTIKPAIACAGLQDGIINAQTSFLSTGGLSVGSWFFPDWKLGGHGVTNVKKALAESVNTFFYYLGGGYGNFIGLGPEKILLYLKAFNFSQKLGIDLPGESSGFIPSPEWKKEQKGEPWYIGDTYNLSIGQGDLLVTPIQIASMVSAIANGGILYQPKIVNTIISQNGTEETSIEPKIINKGFINKNNIEIVAEGMRSCVAAGSCRILSSLPFSSAGKTGTAQWNKNKNNHAWFASYAPYEKPEIVLVILVEEGGEGSGISARIAYEFYKWWWNYKRSFS